MKSIIYLFSAWLSISYILPSKAINDNYVETAKISCPDLSEKHPDWYEQVDYLPFAVLINEIMPDPSPSVYLPEYEYIELVNGSSKPVSLEGWTMDVGTKSYSLSGIIEPGEYLILTCLKAADLFLSYGHVLELFTSTTALTNTGQTLILRDGNGNLIDAVQYVDTWYGDSFKMQGGWALERIDLSNPCAGKENWTASLAHAGGTPGSMNSVSGFNPDQIPPYITGIQFVSDSGINIVFSESIDRCFFNGNNTFILTDQTNPIIRIVPSYPFYNACFLQFSQAFTRGEIYCITPGEGFCDCSGNKPPELLTVRFGIPLLPGFTDVILTEVLYAPFPACSEFIEVYNNSQNLLDLSGIVISLKYSGEEEIKREYITNEQFLFFPGEYLVISANPEVLSDFYHIPAPGCLFTVKKMPSLRDAGGCIELCDRSLQLIDRYCYSKNQHYPLLNDDHGVSLERMDLNSLPGYLGTWHSASSLSGFATPGYANSQSVNELPDEESFRIDPGLFTPDNDGTDDVAVISFITGEQGFTGNVLIFDATGRCERFLARNELLGPEGQFIWDGTDDNGQLSSTGIYLVFFDAFNLKGERIRKKGTVLLVRK